LERLDAAGAVAQLAPLLRERPAVTWSLHIALLSALAKLRLPWPDVYHLRGVDNLHLQAALAEGGGA
jgi:hypothetical protein